MGEKITTQQQTACKSHWVIQKHFLENMKHKTWVSEKGCDFNQHMKVAPDSPASGAGARRVPLAPTVLSAPVGKKSHVHLSAGAPQRALTSLTVQVLI